MKERGSAIILVLVLVSVMALVALGLGKRVNRQVNMAGQKSSGQGLDNFYEKTLLLAENYMNKVEAHELPPNSLDALLTIELHPGGSEVYPEFHNWMAPYLDKYYYRLRFIDNLEASENPQVPGIDEDKMLWIDLEVVDKSTGARRRGAVLFSAASGARPPTAGVLSVYGTFGSTTNVLNNTFDPYLVRVGEACAGGPVLSLGVPGAVTFVGSLTQTSATTNDFYLRGGGIQTAGTLTSGKDWNATIANTIPKYLGWDPSTFSDESVMQNVATVPTPDPSDTDSCDVETYRDTADIKLADDGHVYVRQGDGTYANGDDLYNRPADGLCDKGAETTFKPFIYYTASNKWSVCTFQDNGSVDYRSLLENKTVFVDARLNFHDPQGENPNPRTIADDRFIKTSFIATGAVILDAGTSTSPVTRMFQYSENDPKKHWLATKGDLYMTHTDKANAAYYRGNLCVEGEAMITAGNCGAAGTEGNYAPQFTRETHAGVNMGCATDTEKVTSTETVPVFDGNVMIVGRDWDTLAPGTIKDYATVVTSNTFAGDMVFISTCGGLPTLIGEGLTAGASTGVRAIRD